MDHQNDPTARLRIKKVGNKTRPFEMADLYAGTKTTKALRLGLVRHHSRSVYGLGVYNYIFYNYNRTLN